MTPRIAILPALVLAAACGGSGPSSEQALGEVKQAADAVNAQVPDELKEVFRFEARVVEDDGKAAALVPAGWTRGEMGDYKPPDGTDLGFMTRFEVHTTCDGMCKKKDWAKVLTARIDEMPGDGWTIEQREELPGGFFVRARSGDSVLVEAMFWKASARRYWSCGAWLQKSAVAAADAVAAACRATVPISFD